MGFLVKAEYRVTMRKKKEVIIDLLVNGTFNIKSFYLNGLTGRLIARLIGAFSDLPIVWLRYDYVYTTKVNSLSKGERSPSLLNEKIRAVDGGMQHCKLCIYLVLHFM